ncbi:hypothetical protein F5Y11DRAFT_343136 [Daldinia sp. FL1419]|nr:hypothetical protein F5Y11DRAFT_343136 [Daldinia sp. FL1419]
MAEVALHMGVWIGVDECVDVHTKEWDPARLASDSTDNARAGLFKPPSIGTRRYREKRHAIYADRPITAY